MVFTVAVVQWSVASGRMPRLRDGGDLAEQYTAHAKRVKGERKSGFDGLRSTFTDERARGDLLHSKIMSDLTVGGYAIDVQPVRTEFEFIEADQPLGVISNEYEIRYRTQVADLTQ